MNKNTNYFVRGVKVVVVSTAIATAGGCATAKPEKAEMAAPATPAMEIVKKEMVLDATALFDFDSAELSTQGMSTLNKLLSEMAGGGGHNITVTGHTDRLGDDGYNMKLSGQRADSVAEYMVSKGIAAGSISAMGKGESSPVVQCDDTNWNALVECLGPNRRVVVEYPVVVEEEVMIEN